MCLIPACLTRMIPTCTRTCRTTSETTWCRRCSRWNNFLNKFQHISLKIGSNIEETTHKHWSRCRPWSTMKSFPWWLLRWWQIPHHRWLLFSCWQTWRRRCRRPNSFSFRRSCPWRSLSAGTRLLNSRRGSSCARVRNGYRCWSSRQIVHRPWASTSWSLTPLHCPVGKWNQIRSMDTA